MQLDDMDQVFGIFGVVFWYFVGKCVVIWIVGVVYVIDVGQQSVEGFLVGDDFVNGNFVEVYIMIVVFVVD